MEREPVQGYGDVWTLQFPAFPFSPENLFGREKYPDQGMVVLWTKAATMAKDFPQFHGLRSVFSQTEPPAKILSMTSGKIISTSPGEYGSDDGVSVIFVFSSPLNEQLYSRFHYDNSNSPRALSFGFHKA